MLEDNGEKLHSRVATCSTSTPRTPQRRMRVAYVGVCGASSYNGKQPLKAHYLTFIKVWGMFDKDWTTCREVLSVLAVASYPPPCLNLESQDALDIVEIPLSVK